MKRNPFLLGVIVFAQFFCTSLWFAGNAIVNDLIEKYHFPETSVALFTSSIQLGFIIGTLTYALLSISDRISPSKVFFINAIVAAFANIIFILPDLEFPVALLSRFMTGFFLAGIYPVGMKIAADHFDKSLGKSLGFLVGALVLGSAFPHLVKDYLQNFSYSYVIITTSFASIIGGTAIILFVPDGPFRKKSQKIELSKTFAAFNYRPFKSAAFGYFGHMWELYTFYAFVPLMLKYFNDHHSGLILNISLWSFIIIGVGTLGCFFAGLVSSIFHPKKIASFALGISGFCCLFSPLFLGLQNPTLFIIYALIWGLTIVADSPMFSTIVANNAIPELKGTALTIVNSIGFALTIVSIQLISFLYQHAEFKYIFLVLVIGPVIGLWSLWNRKNKRID